MPLGVFIFAVIITNLEKERRMQAERDTLLREIERKNTELAIAAEIQRSFLPDIIPQVENFDIAATSMMAKEVGGDFFDVIPFEVIRLTPGRIGIMIADVSGKGIPAALFMALSRIVIRVNATWYNDRPEDAIKNANAIITADSKAGMFVTLFYGSLDGPKRTLAYVNAGHNPPLVLHRGDPVFAELPATGIALGVAEDATYSAGTVTFSSGDLLVLHTDGITEVENAREEMFGEGRLRDVILSVSALPAQEVLDAVLQSVRQFCGNHPQSDDITLMVIRAI